MVYQTLDEGNKFFMNKVYLARCAVIAGLYAMLTIVLEPLSFAAVQLRFAEALTVLPILYEEAVIGLFLGCLIANIICGVGVIDIIFGSLATLIAALGTRFYRKKKIAYAFPIVVNALIVGGYLSFLYAMPLAFTMLSILVSELLVVLTLGLFIIKKMSNHL